ncbi:MAG TPA: hypothetical protein ENN85_09380 [Methanoculleus sp.]|nr:hypothetical protein [Methanoculleus sp.]
MIEARRVPREALVAASLGLVLLAAMLFVHTMVIPSAAPATPDERGEEPVPAHGSAADAEDGGAAPAPSFSLTVSPAHAAAKSGETIRYQVSIQAEGGFDAPISLALSASALSGAVTRHEELGAVHPPYDPLSYDFMAPDLPFPVGETTIEAIVTASGGGLTKTQKLTLRVTR